MNRSTDSLRYISDIINYFMSIFFRRCENRVSHPDTDSTLDSRRDTQPPTQNPGQALTDPLGLRTAASGFPARALQTLPAAGGRPLGNASPQLSHARLS